MPFRHFICSFSKNQDRDMEYKFKIDVANIEDTETLVKFQIAMAKESEGTELDYETVREGAKAGIADDSKATYLVARNENGEVLGSLMLTTDWSDWNNCNYLSNVLFLIPYEVVYIYLVAKIQEKVEITNI